MDNPTCATCRWWQRFREPDPCEEQEGYCRRNAPRPEFEASVPSDEDGGRCGYPQWPRLAHYEWCGEHAPRVEAPRCWLHPDRITDGNLLFGCHLCGDCWMEWMVAEAEGPEASLSFRRKLVRCSGESPDASV